MKDWRCVWREPVVNTICQRWRIFRKDFAASIYSGYHTTSGWPATASANHREIHQRGNRDNKKNCYENTSKVVEA